MPSNAPTPQTKPQAPRNASKPATTQDSKSKSPHADRSKTANTIDPHELPGITSSATTTADLLESRVSQDHADEGSSGIGVNKKKQKRRQKQAARKAAEQPSMTDPQFAQPLSHVTDSQYTDSMKERAAIQAQGNSNGYHYDVSDYNDPGFYGAEEEEVVSYGDETHRRYQDSYDPRANGHNVHDYITQDALGGKAKKKKKAKANAMLQDAYSTDNPSLATQRTYQPPPPPPPPLSNQHDSPGLHRPVQHDSKDRIWNTSTAEERERIKDFWLSLGEEDRRSLVKVEKEAVLKKMKEQQKHSCSCTVCGRKRTAIEEELEVLYDAYYEELEVYANPNAGSFAAGAQCNVNAHSMARMPPDPSSQMHNNGSSRGRIQEIGDDDEAGYEEGYSDEEDDENTSDDELEDQGMHPVPSGGTDFFNFGNSLTVQGPPGGILTVADDLLKNDGKKFIEMMEQLAERRMQREEDQYARAGLSHPQAPGHNHIQPPDDDGYDDEEDDEEYDEEDEEFDEEDGMDSLTELERMKEGRRMFQIFAARMFEQRVLIAYREKVALERQKKLLEELDDESRIDAQREAKKAKEAQKKKDKKRQQKEAKDAEKAKREAEKAAEEAAARAFEEKKAEEVRQKKDEQRKKREAEKKAQEEERQRKEIEKQKRLQEAKEQQIEQERKQREQKDREKKKREEIKKQEREEREAKEREAKAKKERDAAGRREREAKIKPDNEIKGRMKEDTGPARKKQSPANAPPTPMPPGLHPPITSSSHTSPRPQIATPVVPKAPTPVRPPQPSFQELQNVSPKASQPASSSVASSPSVSSALQNGQPGKSMAQPAPPYPAQSSSQYSPASISPRLPVHPPGLSSMQTISATPYSSTSGPPLSPIAQQTQHNPAVYPGQVPLGTGPYRNFPTPNGMPYPPGMNGSNQIPPSRGVIMGPQMPHVFGGGLPGSSTNDVNRYSVSRDTISSQTHSRNTSASFDRSGLDNSSIAAQTQPIARPAPIKRPSSVTPHQQGEGLGPRNTEIDDLSNHLGSSALLDDTDSPFNSQLDDSRRGSMAPGAPRTVGQGFGVNSGFSNPIGTTRMDNFPRGMQTGTGKTWSAQQPPFGAAPVSGPPQWSNAPGFGRPNNGNGFGSLGGSSRPAGSRAVTIRLLVCQACEKLTARTPINQNLGWHRADDVLREVQMMKPSHEAPVQMLEMLEICDTEGNGQNGGGSFMTRGEDQVGLLIRFDPGQNTSMSGRGVGDIGSPIVGGTPMPVIGGQRPFQQPGGF